VGYLPWKGEATHEVARVVGKYEQGQPYLVCYVPGAGEPGPGECVLGLIKAGRPSRDLLIKVDDGSVFIRSDGDNHPSASGVNSLYVLHHVLRYQQVM